MSDKARGAEDYFTQIEREQREKLAAQFAKEKADAEAAERKKLHHLRCGKCGGQMTPRDFRGVEIDVCGDCGAVLLDPGELETLAGKDSTGVLGGLAGLFSFRK